MQTPYNDFAGFALLPNELLADIVKRIGAFDPFDATGLCDVDPRMRMWCQEPVFDAALLPPTIQRNLDAPAADEHGPRKISIAEAVRARTRRDTMRRCVLYALYSLYAYMGQAGQGPVGIPVLPFDPAKTDDDWAALLFPAMYDEYGSRSFAVVYVTLHDMGVQLGNQIARVNRQLVRDPPRDQHYAAVNNVLTQALIRAVVDTRSEADTPSLCASIDIQRAFFDDADLPNGHYTKSGNAAVGLNVLRVGHLWYPWTDKYETYESAIEGEPIHVYNDGMFYVVVFSLSSLAPANGHLTCPIIFVFLCTALRRARWPRTAPPGKEEEKEGDSMDWIMDQIMSEHTTINIPDEDLAAFDSSDSLPWLEYD
ncbi:hypothetical protein TW95_gp0663 [Pandoravirus inopinatum]|uniref:Uncharacterized protein n=1 Tax=Pandoravirus inopinatum TaxID=1605721 RepID=A0A0B5JCM4_9VIRU|nr:hypothetical protein TW95_gp0663 [Pandoravirus inopinatum]AJF97397.1 hypothetical protein [Pandoravirus inopinatum]